MMQRKSADEWFDEYSVCHRHPMNKLVHWVCVPAITLCVLALLWALPVPTFMSNTSDWFNWAVVVTVLSLIFYARLSPIIAIGMGIFSGSCLTLIRYYEQLQPDLLWPTALVVFVVAWVGQFVGHKIEGRKPAFFQDLQYLLIGPAWLLGFIYRRVGVRY